MRAVSPLIPMHSMSDATVYEVTIFSLPSMLASGFSLSVLVCCLHGEAKRVPKCFWLCLDLAVSLLTKNFSVVRYFGFWNNRWFRFVKIFRISIRELLVLVVSEASTNRRFCFSGKYPKSEDCCYWAFQKPGRTGSFRERIGG